MAKAGYGYLAFALVLLPLAVYVGLPSGAGLGALESEKTFIAGIHSSLYALDRVKEKWREEKSKSEQDVPTMEDLAPYLGDSANKIAGFVALGITYKLAPVSEQGLPTDSATLSSNLRFQKGISRFYLAGTSYSMSNRWIHPPHNTRTTMQAFYFNNREMLAAGMFVLGMVSLTVFLARIGRNSRELCEGDDVRNV